MVKITTITITAVKKRHRLRLADLVVVCLNISGTVSGEVQILQGKSVINILINIYIKTKKVVDIKCIPGLFQFCGHVFRRSGNAAWKNQD